MSDTMGRYILLCGDQYYPCRWGDFVGSYESIEAAKAAAYEGDWAQIVDKNTDRVVCRGVNHSFEKPTWKWEDQ